MFVLLKYQNSQKSLNRTVTAHEIEAVIKNLLAHISPGLESLTAEFHKTFKEQLTPILHRLFPKIQDEGRLPHSFDEAR